jgi:hypothetical protein
VAWATGTSLNRNPRFAKKLDAKVGPKSVNALPVNDVAERVARFATQQRDEVDHLVSVVRRLARA